MLRNVLLAHGHAAAKLRNISSDALLSCNFNINWAIPLTDSADDKVHFCQAPQNSRQSSKAQWGETSIDNLHLYDPVISGGG